MARAKRWLVVGTVAAFALAVACGDDDEGGPGGASGIGGTGGTGGPDVSPEQTGDQCEVAADCFPDVDHTQLSGDVLCLERVRDGYCTHYCDTDDDCCAAPGECETDLRQVCSPFESFEGKLCFLSCEDVDLRPLPDAGTSREEIDETEYCQAYAHPDFTCRSSGGGVENRKICVPGGACGDPVLVADYPACIQASDEQACLAAGGVWSAVGSPEPSCHCPTGQDGCQCTTADHCLSHCVALVPGTGDCGDVSQGHCTAATWPTDCWCVFDAAGVATERCF